MWMVRNRLSLEGCVQRLSQFVVMGGTDSLALISPLHSHSIGATTNKWHIPTVYLLSIHRVYQDTDTATLLLV